MGITNRSKDNSEKNEVIHWKNQLPLTSGETGVFHYVSTPSVLLAGNIGCLDNPSTAANMFLTISRFIVGTGLTTITLGSTFVPPIFGTSGVIPSGISLPASGNTLLNLMPGDVFGYQIGGGSTAYISGMCAAFVLRPVQDIRVFLGGLA